MNRRKVCVLPAPLHIAFSANWSEQWVEKKQRFPYLPDYQQALAELGELSQQEGVPAILSRNTRGKETLRVYGSDYYLGLYPSSRGDGYTLGYINPLDLRSHEDLARGTLFLKGPGYRLYPQLSYIPAGSTNYWEYLQRTWNALEEQKRAARAMAGQAPARLTPEHENYLNTIDTLIDVTSQLEQDKYKLSALLPYTRVDSAGEQRHTLRDVYTFHLARSAEVFNEKYMLRIQGVRDLRGRIFSRDGNKVTIKFETQIDKQRIPRQGNLEIMPNNRIFELQHRAVRMLREGEVRNPHLLSILVDNHYQPHHSVRIPHEKLNMRQQQAFQQALTVPDMLLVLGPPGTGKTRTITEIVHHHCSVNRKRTLIASGTHKAVDNILQLLPETLEVVRIGHEDRVAENARHLLIDTKAKAMQASTLEQTHLQATMLAHFIDDETQITAWFRRLQQLIENLTRNEREKHALVQRVEQIIERVSGPYKNSLDEYISSLHEQRQALTQCRDRISRRQGVLAKVAPRRSSPLLGWFFTWRYARCEKLIEVEQQRLNQLHTLYVTTEQRYQALQNARQQALWADGEYRMGEDSKQQLEREGLSLQKEAGKIAATLQGTIGNLLPSQPALATITLDALKHFMDWFGRAYPLLQRRARLVRDWRKMLEGNTEQLWPEILRYADVIGATCIGIATIEGLEDADFDLAIVDEAGQICLPDLLVPLVRARRAVLVGDHQQLPPFVDNEVQNWLKTLSLQKQEALSLAEEEEHRAIADLLTRSAFELLFSESARNGRLITLTEQFRMPGVIASFASRHFYGGQLVTARSSPLRVDPLFQRPLALVDTSDVVFSARKEQRHLGSEHWKAVPGYSNQIEAGLIARIAAYYEEAQRDWVIIVPYRAQAQCIIHCLQQYIDASDLRLEERVATVDSFQGGECDNVLYGFTRSNQKGEVGFLKELRRLNVAITRARQQLVLVGDLSTLTRATDTDFRNLMLSLYQHTQESGELLTYEQCQRRLTLRTKEGV